MTTTSGMPELDALRALAHAKLLRIVRRAKSTGALRADFRAEDVVLLLMANAGLVQRTSHAAPTAWRRTLSFTLDGLRAPAATKPAPSPGREAVERAMGPPRRPGQ